MAKLPEKFNPLLKETIYQQLNVDSKASNQDVTKAVEKISKMTSKKGKGKEKNPELESLLKPITLLKRNFTRVTVNAMILEKVELDTVKEYLKQLPNLKSNNVRLPKLDLSQVHIEGKNIEISEKDFHQIESDFDVELDTNELKEHLLPKKIDQHHFFET